MSILIDFDFEVFVEVVMAASVIENVTTSHPQRKSAKRFFKDRYSTSVKVANLGLNLLLIFLDLYLNINHKKQLFYFNSPSTL